MAMWADEYKLAVNKWLKKNHREISEDPEKCQNFLFLYECFSKAEGEDVD